MGEEEGQVGVGVEGWYRDTVLQALFAPNTV